MLLSLLCPKAPRGEQAPNQAYELLQKVIDFSLSHTDMCMDAGTCIKPRHIYPSEKNVPSGVSGGDISLGGEGQPWDLDSQAAGRRRKQQCVGEAEVPISLGPIPSQIPQGP